MSIQRGYAIEDAKKDLTLGASVLAGQNVNEPKKDPKYTKLESKKEGTGLEKCREQAELADKPTTANAEKGTKDLPSAISQVGNAAAYMQNMYSMMSMISAIAGGGSQTSRKKVIEDSLSGALAILVKKYNYDLVMSALNKALENNGIKFIDEVYRSIVKNAIANLYKAAVEYGPNNIPVYTYSTVTTIGPVPSPLVTTVPEMYTQQYYVQSEDPYPGYIKWISADLLTYVFTERKIGDKYYVSAQEEVYSISEQELADALDPYIRDQNLTAQILNDLLTNQESNVEYNTNEKTLGKGSGSNGANAMQLIMTLIGYISTMTNKQKSTQLPNSVLNQGSISKTLADHEKRMAEAKKMKPLLKAAATPPQSMQSLLDVTNLPSNIQSLFSSSSTV